MGVCTVHIPIRNVILLILRSQMDFCAMEMILGSQKGHDYVHFKWVCALAIQYTSFIRVHLVDQMGVKVLHWR